MRLWMFGTVAALGMMVLTSGTASACHRCRQTPCVIAPPAPRVECVTDMVPYTVMKTRTRMDYQPVTETVMARVPETTWTERQRVVCKPVFDTATVQKRIMVRKPVYDTQYVNRTVTTCRPVTETHQVTTICMQPTTTYQTVPVTMKRGHCGLCGKSEVVCGCKTVAKTCYTPVPVVRDVVAMTDGVVSAIDLRAIGMTIVGLGGGRSRPEDSIDHSVGFDRLLGLGAKVSAGTPLGRVHARSTAEAAMAAERLRAAYAVGNAAPSRSLIADRLLPEVN